MSVRKQLLAGASAMTITLASLASSTAGVGRQSTLIDNTSNLYLSAMVTVAVRVGTTPTANSLIYVYLIRSDNNAPLVDDAAGATDAGITIVNAPLLGTMLVPSNTSNVTYTKTFDTSFLGPLGPKWGIALVNSSGVALNASGHSVTFNGVTEQVV